MKRLNFLCTFSLLIALLTLAGCGKKGQLVPPDALVPAAVPNMQVRQQGEAFRITWQAPEKELSGRPLRDLAGFRLLKRLIAGGDCASCADSWQLLAEIDLDLAGKSSKAGATFIHFDREISPGERRQYRLLAFSRSGGAGPAETSPDRLLLPAVAAPAIAVTPLPASLKITCDFTAPASAKLIGFNIYRRTGTDAPSLLPLNREPLRQPDWEDQQLQFGQTYRYFATAVVEISGETVESLPSAEREIVFSVQEQR